MSPDSSSRSLDARAVIDVSGRLAHNYRSLPTFEGQLSSPG